MPGSLHKGCKPWDLDRIRAARALAVQMREHACAQRQHAVERRGSAPDASQYTSPVLPTRVGAPASLLLTIGGSAGALSTVIRIVASLPESSPVAVAVALHGSMESHLVALLQRRSVLPVRWAASMDYLRAGYVYVAPPGRHLIVNPDARLTVSSAARRRQFLPSVDWLFDSAAVSFRERHIAVVLSGRLDDGARGIRTTHRLGGGTFAQDPASSAFADMPRAAVETGCVRNVVSAVRLPNVIARAVSRYGEEEDVRWQEPFAS